MPSALPSNPESKVLERCPYAWAGLAQAFGRLADLAAVETHDPQRQALVGMLVGGDYRKLLERHSLVWVCTEIIPASFFASVGHLTVSA